jgi:hypothetical protein
VGRSHIGVVVNGEIAHYRGIISCAGCVSVHLCPRWAPKIRAARCAEIQWALDIHAGHGLVVGSSSCPHIVDGP